jgi:hypothetical protein
VIIIKFVASILTSHCLFKIVFFTALVKLKQRSVQVEVKNAYNFCGGREKLGKSNNFKNELTMFTP